MALANSHEYLYLTTTGRVTGRAHEIEIWYVAYDGCCFLVSEKGEASDWVKNIRHNPALTFRLGDRLRGRLVHGQGRPLDPAAEPDRVAAVRSLMDSKYGWSNGLVVELRPNT
ncbi:MAG: nitroreductase/quinone reductase family protein [Phototrophicaceae bacterium]